MLRAIMRATIMHLLRTLLLCSFTFWTPREEALTSVCISSCCASSSSSSSSCWLMSSSSSSVTMLVVFFLNLRLRTAVVPLLPSSSSLLLDVVNSGCFPGKKLQKYFLKKCTEYFDQKAHAVKKKKSSRNKKGLLIMQVKVQQSCQLLNLVILSCSFVTSTGYYS